MLIAFEGIDGAGKSTQAKLLYRWLRKQGDCVFTEWNSSPLTRKAIRQAKQKRAFLPLTYSLLHAADFADRHERVIQPALDEGKHVIADRYVYTAYARDVARGCERHWVGELYSFATKPDLVFWVTIRPEVALSRKKCKPNWYEAGRDVFPRCDAYESYCLYQQRVIEEYERQGTRMYVIDGELSAKKQQRQIREMVLRRMGTVRKVA